MKLNKNGWILFVLIIGAIILGDMFGGDFFDIVWVVLSVGFFGLLVFFAEPDTPATKKKERD